MSYLGAIRYRLFESGPRLCRKPDLHTVATTDGSDVMVIRQQQLLLRPHVPTELVFA